MTKTKRVHSLAKGQRHQIRISALAPGGEGLSKDLGPPIFVNRVAPGDLIEVELFDVRKDFAKGKMINLLEPSAQRAEPPCSLFKVCGGCQWQHLSYESQLLNKEDLLRQAVTRIGGLDGALVGDIVGAEKPLNYRNKVQFPVRNPRDSSRILAGYFKQDSHELVNIKHCPVQPLLLDEILEAAKTACEANGISAYDEKAHRGLLRHINMRYSFGQGKVLLTFVLNSTVQTLEELKAEPFYRAVEKCGADLCDQFGELVGLNVNLNAAVGNKILGDLNFAVFGDDRIVETLATSRADLPDKLRKGLDFSLSPSSFFQVNTEQTVKLLELVWDACLGDSTNRVIIDAYAGVGTISLWLAGLAERVIAIEEHPAAVSDGLANAEANLIANVTYELGRVEQVLPLLAASGLKADIVVLDPPRKGVDAEALEAIRLLNPHRVVYVSCNPATLARDLKILATPPAFGRDGEENSGLPGYKTKQVRPVDLFPQTYHVESIAILERF